MSTIPIPQHEAHKPVNRIARFPWRQADDPVAAPPRPAEAPALGGSASRASVLGAALWGTVLLALAAAALALALLALVPAAFAVAVLLLVPFAPLAVVGMVALADLDEPAPPEVSRGPRAGEDEVQI
jgi:hypothetical protein